MPITTCNYTQKAERMGISTCFEAINRGSRIGGSRCKVVLIGCCRASGVAIAMVGCNAHEKVYLFSGGRPRWLYFERYFAFTRLQQRLSRNVAKVRRSSAWPWQMVELEGDKTIDNVCPSHVDDSLEEVAI